MRSSVGARAALLRRRDDGARFERIAGTSDPMLGFALSDGRKVWYGSGTEGIWRSDDAGESFERVNALPTYCLRFHGGALWACSDWQSQPFALGRSRDEGRSFEPVLRFRNIVPPAACPDPTPGQRVCEERWLPLQREILVGDEPDAGSEDVVPFDAPAQDVARMEVDAAIRPALRASGGCACTAGVGETGGLAPCAAAGGWALLGACRRRRTTPRDRSQAAGSKAR